MRIRPVSSLRCASRIAALATTFTLALALGVPAHAKPESGTWTEIAYERGIRVWRLDVPGEDFPGFKGATVIDAPAARIVEEIKDVEHHTEWMDRCAAAEILKKIDDDHVIVYNRTDVPWPVSDRDAVLDTQFTYASGGKLTTLTFKTHDTDLKPAPKGVVRMPKLEGFYRLWQMSPTKTKVVYQVEVDIGGAVPQWMAERVAKEMPFETLSRLRKRALRER